MMHAMSVEVQTQAGFIGIIMVMILGYGAHAYEHDERQCQDMSD